MYILSDKFEEDLDNELGIVAQWWYDKSVPTTIKDIEALEKPFAVKNVEDKGEYYKKPDGAVGVIVLSLKKLAAMAAWRNEGHQGPWQVYGEQEKGTIAFHFVGDTEIVFIGWV